MSTTATVPSVGQRGTPLANGLSATRAAVAAAGVTGHASAVARHASPCTARAGLARASPAFHAVERSRSHGAIAGTAVGCASVPRHGTGMRRRDASRRTASRFVPCAWNAWPVAIGPSAKRYRPRVGCPMRGSASRPGAIAVAAAPPARSPVAHLREARPEQPLDHPPLSRAARCCERQRSAAPASKPSSPTMAPSRGHLLLQHAWLELDAEEGAERRQGLPWRRDKVLEAEQPVPPRVAPRERPVTMHGARPCPRRPGAARTPRRSAGSADELPIRERRPHARARGAAPRRRWRAGRAGSGRRARPGTTRAASRRRRGARASSRP